MNQVPVVERTKTAFEKAKEILQSAQLLVHSYPQTNLILASDASDYGVGAVLTGWIMAQNVRLNTSPDHSMKLKERRKLCESRNFINF